MLLRRSPPSWSLPHTHPFASPAEIRRDTGYYPDTPLSVNHPIMKGKPLRPPDEAPSSHPKIGYFGFKTYGTPAAMGVKEIVLDDPQRQGEGIPKLGAPPIPKD